MLHRSSVLAIAQVESDGAPLGKFCEIPCPEKLVAGRPISPATREDALRFGAARLDKILAHLGQDAL